MALMFLICCLPLVLAACRGGGPAPSPVPPTPAPSGPRPTPPPLPSQGDGLGSNGLPWWNDRVFYEVFVRSFADSDGDGAGDLRGLIGRLDYLNDGDPAAGDDLGVSGLWLMPVMGAASYHGYDVVDYYGIEPDYGSLEDFRLLLQEAHRRGLVVIIDLVMNHTSVEHPWFQASTAPDSPFRQWYIWSDDPPFSRGPWGQPVWHRRGRQFYYGLFWEGMPDLNLRNPEVTTELYDIARFWLDEVGVDGFRLDAVKHLIEAGSVQQNTPQTHAWLQHFQSYLDSFAPHALTVGEAWTTLDESVDYTGDEVDIVFEFDLAQAMLDSAIRGDERPVSFVLGNVLRAYPPGQYATFLSNHDQNRVMSQVKGDVDTARIAASLLLTAPGVPFIYYGEEIGMQGEKPDERIRTPMQWDGSKGAGFTSGRPWERLGPGVETFNVAALRGQPGSLLNHYRALIDLRRRHSALRSGEYIPVQSDLSAVHAFLRRSAGEGETLMVLMNLSRNTVDAYTLSLEQGPLAAVPAPALLLGAGAAAALAPNAAGGFEAYTPLAQLPPKSTYVIDLSR